MSIPLTTPCDLTNQSFFDINLGDVLENTP